MPRNVRGVVLSRPGGNLVDGSPPDISTAAGKIGPPIGQRLSVKNEKYFATF